MFWILSAIAFASNIEICNPTRPVSMDELREIFENCIIHEGTRITIYIEESDSSSPNHGIGFMPGETKLNSNSEATLDGVWSLLKLRKGYSVQIIGHADASEIQFKHPEELSIERAKAASEYLIKKGIDPSRITIEGMGANELIDISETPEGQALNRRVEFIVFKTP
jgi:outer membrane protein OmpA-like peptidoglycan-associated protein